MTGVMGAVVTYGVLMGILRTYGVQAIGAPISGIVADKIGGPSIVIASRLLLRRSVCLYCSWCPQS